MLLSFNRTWERAAIADGAITGQVYPRQAGTPVVIRFLRSRARGDA
jgi:hypothetical protein